ncbi:MAG TPA: SGNH/GDSL hydrolase family protein [Polyangiaceae bacterium]|nr:SGNH/GDSL hydrolase family protein [Polyangiaceae bacterium]
MALSAIACSSSTTPDTGAGGQVPGTSGGTSGTPASGGAGATSAGGRGGATSSQTGGSTATGGSVSTGGANASGGSSSPSGGATTGMGGGAGLSGGGAGGTSGAGGSSGGTDSKGGTSGSGAGGGNAGAGAGGKTTGESGGAGGRGGASGDGGTGGSNGGASGGSTSFRPCPANDPCKILPLGDSITHGLQSSDNAGYRSQLFKLAVADNKKLTFTGSQSSGPNQVSGATFPKNHEGHDGWTVDPGFSKYGSGGISSLIPSPALSTMPNIVLLMIGTNDITSTDTPGATADRLDGFLGKLVQAAPDALIVVAQITPVAYDSADLKNYNSKIPGLVQARVAKGQHLIGVDMSKMPTSGLASDKVHPNDQGYAYMANVWYEAIKGYLPN